MLRRYFSGSKLSQRGDTIVEVLIAIAVISMILGGAYITTNKSLMATRGAQERGNALKLAESQVEELKSVIATQPDAVFGGSAPSPFCVYNNPTTGILQVLASTSPNCKVDTAGNPATNEPSFSLSINRSTNDFTVKNDWTDVAGNVADHLQIKYRAYR
jgi:prepilin-type N-terminal cleavage/methylation domain-containing protein